MNKISIDASSVTHTQLTKVLQDPRLVIEAEDIDPVAEAYGQRVRADKEHGTHCFGPGAKAIRVTKWPKF